MTLSLPHRYQRHKADYPPQVDDETHEERTARIARNVLLGLSDDVRLGQTTATKSVLRLLDHEAGLFAASTITSPFLKAVTLSETAANLVHATEVENPNVHIEAIKALAEAALADLPSTAGIVTEDYLAAINMTNSEYTFREAVEMREDIRLLAKTQRAEQQARIAAPAALPDATGEISLTDKK